ncbi:hypothetical protein IE81DRAFT_169177 [Ceraceosorus guamensis]|uniref:Uncharacterized protein n=1 Tax=Ceraceosorus guamensis TaxID=1522189 RepID=A0A316VVI4_9BASI|nr:hypothetical protein IE81DRAFT_169177 [Ceraceosorus guamensis]PWN41616.1 hypothetical protein IE81DRAFT_169177 [Ceraceosorus guamensis]
MPLCGSEKLTVEDCVGCQPNCIARPAAPHSQSALLDWNGPVALVFGGLAWDGDIQAQLHRSLDHRHRSQISNHRTRHARLQLACNFERVPLPMPIETPQGSYKRSPDALALRLPPCRSAHGQSMLLRAILPRRPPSYFHRQDHTSDRHAATIYCASETETFRAR